MLSLPFLLSNVRFSFLQFIYFAGLEHKQTYTINIHSWQNHVNQLFWLVSDQYLQRMWLFVVWERFDSSARLDYMGLQALQAALASGCLLFLFSQRAGPAQPHMVIYSH